MQVSPMISTLLAGLIIMLSLHAVHSLSVSRRSEPQFFTLPIHRIPDRSDIHPQILLQLHINHSIRRLAKMTGAEPPSDHSLRQRLERRMLSLDVPSGIDRRFNRVDVRNEGDVQLEKRFNQVGVSRRDTGLNVTIAETPTANNSLGLDIQGQDIGYLATIQIGTPPRDFLILMDSGSADFWVGSEECETLGTTNAGCGNHNFLGPNSSSSFKDLSKKFNVTYGTGAVNGSIIADKVIIAGLTLCSHTFGVANQETSDFTVHSSFDGLMGLAQSTLSMQQTLTPVEALKAAGLIANAITSYSIPRLGDGNDTGEITFGGIDPNKFKPNSSVTLPNVNKHGFWEANLDGATLNGSMIIANRRTVLDTGTTLMLVSEEDAILIHDHIPGARKDGLNDGGFVIPCNTVAFVSLTYGGQAFPIDPNDIVRGPTSEHGLCGSGIVSDKGAFPSDVWLVGDVFLKNAYYSTNVDTNSLSLAIPV